MVKDKPEDAIEKCLKCNGKGKYKNRFSQKAHCDQCFGEGWIRQKHIDEGLIEREG